MDYKEKIITRTKVDVKVVLATLFLIGGSMALAAAIEQKSYEKEVAALMEKMKLKGCIADGLLSGYGKDTENSIALIERSQCQYLHRAVETWAAPPDFELVQKNLAQFKKPYIQGMFLAEAIGVNSKYAYPEEDRMFDFGAMCRGGTEGFWGEGTCRADLEKKEYQKYVKYITRQAIDLGIQSFMFGQVYWQDSSQPSTKTISKVISEMKDYASSKGKTIVVGGQTNDITDEKYLKTFDYIEGGVGVYDNGEIEDGPCLEGLWKSGGGACWGLLWHKNYSAKAKNVLLHLDWSGLAYDDMSRFARMKPEMRIKTLRSLYQNFTSQNMGFLMPFLAVVARENGGGCYGPNPEFYSPDEKYSCKDEESINAFLTEGGSFNGASFLMEDVPLKMTAGEKYSVSITFKNSGNSSWTKEKQFFIGPQNPVENNIWPAQIDLADGEEIVPGQEKKFSFVVIAPSAPGTYNFQWRMAEGPGGWFGDNSENVRIMVSDGLAE